MQVDIGKDVFPGRSVSSREQVRSPGEDFEPLTTTHALVHLASTLTVRILQKTCSGSSSYDRADLPARKGIKSHVGLLTGRERAVVSEWERVGGQRCG